MRKASPGLVARNPSPAARLEAAACLCRLLHPAPPCRTGAGSLSGPPGGTGGGIACGGGG